MRSKAGSSPTLPAFVLRTLQGGNMETHTATEHSEAMTLKVTRAEARLARARAELEKADAELAPVEAAHLASGDGFVGEFLLLLRHKASAAFRAVGRAEDALADAKARAEAPTLPGME